MGGKQAGFSTSVDNEWLCLKLLQADGGPGLEQLSMILQTSLRREQDLRTLMASQILFWLLRAPEPLASSEGTSTRRQRESDTAPMQKTSSRKSSHAHRPGRLQARASFTLSASGVVGWPSKRDSSRPSSNKAPCEASTSHDASAAANPSGRPAALSAAA